MAGRLENLYLLGNALNDINRYVYPFKFIYNNVTAYVVYHRLEKPYKKFWTIRLSFINFANREADFECYANQNSLDVSYTAIKNFFNLNDAGNNELKDIFNGFYEYFNEHIPTTVEDVHDKKLRIAALEYIQNNDDENDRIYIFDIRKTSGEKRSKYNNDKAAFLYPDIYNVFRTDYSLSFFFSADVTKEKKLKELLDIAIRRGYF